MNGEPAARVGPADDGTVVTVPAGRRVEAVLPQRGGTGYRWVLDPLPPGATLISEHTEPAGTGAAAGGEHGGGPEAGGGRGGSGPEAGSGRGGSGPEAAGGRQAEPGGGGFGPVGAGGRRVFGLVVSEPVRITARLYREWEGPDAAVESFSVQLVPE